MKIQRVHILSLILAFVFSGASIFFLSQNQSYIDQETTRLPEVFEQSTGQVELAFEANPSSVKVGEKSTIKLKLVNKNNTTIKDIIYKITVPDQFTIDANSLPENGFINSGFGVFLSGVELSGNDIIFYMVNYPSLDTNLFLINGLELISFDIVSKDTAKLGSYQLSFNNNFTNQFLDTSKNNILGKVTNSTITVIDSSTGVVEKPKVNPYLSATYNQRILISGTKVKGSGLKVNNQFALSETAELDWKFDLLIPKPGKNIYTFNTYIGSIVSEAVGVEIFQHGRADLRVDVNSVTGLSSVDARDLAVFASSYYLFKNEKNGAISPTDATGYRLSDMNNVAGTSVVGDGKIDAKDLSEFIKNWKRTYKYE